jgi:hypothetical protein
MLAEMFPRIHARLASLRVLGPLLDEFVGWLHARGYPPLPIRLRVRAAPRLEARLRRRRIRDVGQLSCDEWLALAPRATAADVYLAALVHSFARFLDERRRLRKQPPTPDQQLVAAYCGHLERVRGLAASTVRGHARTAVGLLSFVGFEVRLSWASPHARRMGIWNVPRNHRANSRRRVGVNFCAGGPPPACACRA